VECTSLNFLEQGRDEFVVERKSTNKEDVENDTTGPNINFGTGIQLSANNFRCCIIWTSTARLEEIAVCHDVTEAEVGNLDVHVLVQKQVLRLEISVHNLVAVTIFDSAYDLLKQFPSFGFSQPTMLDDVIEQFHRYVFEHHVNVGLGGDDCVELDDVGMPKQLEILDLSFDATSHISTDQLSTVDRLHGNLLTSDLVPRELDLAKRAFTNVPNETVLM